MSQEKISFRRRDRCASFNRDLAIELDDLNAAIIYENIGYHLDKFEEEGIGKIDGHTYYFQTAKQISNYLKFFSEKQVQLALKKLVDTCHFIAADLSKDRFHRPTYYRYPTMEEYEKYKKSKKECDATSMAERKDIFKNPEENQGLKKSLPNAMGGGTERHTGRLYNKTEEYKHKEEQQQSLQVSHSLLDSASVVVSFKKFLEETKLSPEEQEQICKTLAKDPDPNPELLKQIVLDVFHENYKKPDSYVAAIRSFYRDRKRPTLRPGPYDEHKNQVRIYNDFLEKKGYVEIAKFNKNALEKDKYIRVINDSERGYTTCNWCNGLKTLEEDIIQSVKCIMDRQEGV